jgi:hypothetical protein
MCFSIAMVLAVFPQIASSQDFDERWKREEQLTRQISSAAALDQLIARLSRPDLRISEMRMSPILVSSHQLRDSEGKG